VHWREMKILHLKLLRRMQVKTFHWLSRNITKQSSRIGYFRFSWIKNDVETGMYFDSSIPQGYGVGSSGALVAAIYDRYAQDKNCSREFNSWKLLQLKYSLKWKLFSRKSSGLDPLNSYLSIPMINSKIILKLQVLNQTLDGKGAVFC
jgi:mevalonate kinase